MTGCGSRQGMGHGETLICGEEWGHGIYICAECRNRLLLARIEGLKHVLRALVEFSDNGTPIQPGAIQFDDARELLKQ